MPKKTDSSEETIPTVAEEYNQTLPGHFGEFGTGADSQIFFIQSGIKPSHLDKISLISDLKGSDTWPVRDLFQRDVDIKRVYKKIVPYLERPDQVKFFNPLTLTVLPFNEKTQEILTSMPHIVQSEYEDKNGKWECFELKDFYRFRYLKNRPQYGLLEWNDSRIKIVAIDGQHRLSALKMLKSDVAPHPEKHEIFMQWTIPVVIFGLRLIREGIKKSILDIIRSIFIYINTTAQSPNRARQILLSDESINDICTQEIVQYSHSNDVKDLKDRSDKVLPLLFYDWRGEEDEGRRIISPASVKTIEEINDWFINYLFGEDFSEYQEMALGIQVDEPLHNVFVRQRLDSESANKTRLLFKERYLPGFLHFLETFKPYAEYTQQLRSLEKEMNAKSAIARHAFHQLRFGSNTAGDDLQKEIHAVYEQIINKITAIKEKTFSWDLLSLDIGMRGVIYALSELYQYYNKSKKGQRPWLEYCKWFTENINRVYDAGWFSNKPDIEGLLLHITHDATGHIVNYRFNDVESGFGAMMVILASAIGKSKTKIPDEEVRNEINETYMDELSGTLLRGYRKQVRSELVEEGIRKNSKEWTERLEAEPEKRKNKHLQRITKYLNSI